MIFNIYIPDGYDENYNDYENAAFPSLFDYEIARYYSISTTWLQDVLPVEADFDELYFIIDNRYKDGMHQPYE